MQELQDPIRPGSQSPSRLPLPLCSLWWYNIISFLIVQLFFSNTHHSLYCLINLSNYIVSFVYSSSILLLVFWSLIRVWFASPGDSGETKRKFESVYSGGTMDTADSGKVFQYWHCCGSEDPFHPGCTASPHSSYDDWCTSHSSTINYIITIFPWISLTYSCFVCLNWQGQKNRK